MVSQTAHLGNLYIEQACEWAWVCECHGVHVDVSGQRLESPFSFHIVEAGSLRLLIGFTPVDFTLADL